MSPRIEIAIEIEAPPPKVFEALTRTSELERWFAEKAFVSDAEGRFDFWGRHTPGNPDREGGRHRLSAFEEGKRIAFVWKLRNKETTVDIAARALGSRDPSEADPRCSSARCDRDQHH